jgi:nucleosome binding factor SPN SPT16 subunit
LARKKHLCVNRYCRQTNHIQHFQDIQFIREASDVQFDETGNRKRKHRYGDEDEIEMEQQERKRRAMLNKEFKAFAEKIAEAASTSVSASMDCIDKNQKANIL